MARQRLTLSGVGIKSPLDVASAADASAPAAPAEDESASAAVKPKRVPREQGGSRSQQRSTTRREPSPRPRPGAPADVQPFYGSGRRVQTSIALDAEQAGLLEELARAAHVTVNALAVASLHAGLPTRGDEAVSAIVDERVRRVGLTRVERNLRIPLQLRTRMDELVAIARSRVPHVNRADLVNAALVRGMPADAQQAAELVTNYARRLEGAAAA